MHNRAKYLVLALFAILICLILWDFLFWSGRFPPNSFIERLDVSGLSRFEALEKLKSANVDKITLSPIRIQMEGRVLTCKPSEIGLFISPRKTVFNNSLSTIYRSDYVVGLFRRLSGAYKKQVIPLALDPDEQIYNKLLKELANETNVTVKDATFALVPENRYIITKEKVGRKVDIEGSLLNLKTALDNNKREVNIKLDIIYPRVYANVLVKHPPKALLSEYNTYYGSHDSPNRVHNIKLAASRTNNYVLLSGEVFSLLNELGDFNRESGYKEAFVLYNGELEPQYGGGSCQIASTFYNAALLAGLDILERHNHGIYFTIYPLGRDASIYTRTRDLKVRNNTAQPIYIKAYATDKKLTYMIYGTPTAKKVSFSRPMIFFDGEKRIQYNVMTEEAKEKINKALLSGRSFSTYVKITTFQAGYEREKTIVSRYKLTGDKENVKIVRPEPD